ncbi:branched-chain amino acid ABC transporter permease [Synergistaceae bacterium OttesenSCG-928-I11]|nr:branched-chain amino acid ABC transporter permease [Synergistaceae bacterium OttesenSCG-928-I11]
MSVSNFVQVLVDGLLNGAVYALVAAGLSLIWGVMDVINFAHGEFLMVAMYACYWLGVLLGLDPLYSWVFTGAFLFLLSAACYKFIVRRSLGKAAMAPLLATFGLSIFLKNFCLNRFTPNFRLLSGTIMDGKVIRFLDASIPVPQLVTALFSLLMLGVLYYIIKKTRIGWAIQATAMDREAAELMGIDTEWIFTLVFGLGGLCVGIAGGFMTSYLAVFPEAGALFSLIAFVVVALGGFGSIPGALLAAILIGLVESFAGFYIAPVVKYVAVFSLYLIVILIRPKGLFGW